MYPSVTEVTPAEEYRLFVSLENGERGILDMQPFLDPEFVYRNCRTTVDQSTGAS